MCKKDQLRNYQSPAAAYKPVHGGYPTPNTKPEKKS